MSHTPGPWTPKKQMGQTMCVQLPNGDVWAVITPRKYISGEWGLKDLSEMDALLISQAPELLCILTKAVNEVIGLPGKIPYWYEDAKKAIAKAGGE